MRRWRPLLSLPERTLSIDTDELATIALTVFKCAMLEFSTICVIIRPHNVVDVRSILCCIWSVGCTERELVGAHKVVPFFDLDPVSFSAWDVIAEDKAAFGIASSIGTMRIQLSAVVAFLDVELGEIANASYLEEVGRFEELHTLNGSIWNEPSAIARLETVGNNALLVCADLRVWVDGTPKAEIIGVVDENILAERGGRGSTPLLALVGSRLAGFPFVGEVVDGEVGLVLRKYGGGEEGSKIG